MSIDWSIGMQQRIRYYEVDRSTWRDYREIDGVASCDVTRDLESSTLESAKLTIVGGTISEAVIRAYIECRQDGPWERFGIGTWICQTPRRTWRRGVGELEVRAYSPLLAVKDDKPPVFHTVHQGVDPAVAAIAALKHGIAPVHACSSGNELDEPWSCDIGDSWLDEAWTMAGYADMGVRVRSDGEVYLDADREPSALAPVWTYEDGANSILIGGIDDECDWYGLPNVVQVVASTDTSTFVGEAVNNDGASALSTVSRGRDVVERITDPELAVVTQASADRLARKKMEELGHVERRLTYEHGYCPVVIGDCVRVLSRRHGVNAKARVVKQTLSLKTGCTVTEEATCKMAMGGSI